MIFNNNIIYRFVEYLSSMTHIDEKFIVSGMYLLSGLFQLKTFKNWEKANSDYKFYAKLWIIGLCIMTLALIFD